MLTLATPGADDSQVFSSSNLNGRLRESFPGWRVNRLSTRRKVERRFSPGLRIDPGRLMSKLLDVLDVRPGINSMMAVRAALTAQFQHT